MTNPNGTSKVKEHALQLVAKLSENATWDDLMYQVYVRQAIEAGMADSDAGHTVSNREVRTRFGLSA